MPPDGVKRLVECANALFFFENLCKLFWNSFHVGKSETLWARLETALPFVPEVLAVFGEILNIHYLKLLFEMLVFSKRIEPEYPEKNLSEQGRKPITISTHIWCWHQDSNLDQIRYCEKYHNILKIVFSIWEHYDIFCSGL